MSDNPNDMQRVKRAFFALRNGMLGDLLRKQGLNYKIIFGLNLPQLSQIAEQMPHDALLAQQLWENKSTRESMLLAPMLYPREQLSIDVARQWIKEIPTPEVADVLCHRLLRHTDYAYNLAIEYIDANDELQRYCALRLLFNLLPSNTDEAAVYAQKELERGNSLTKSICVALIDEINFMKGV